MSKTDISRIICGCILFKNKKPSEDTSKREGKVIKGSRLKDRKVKYDPLVFV